MKYVDLPGDKMLKFPDDTPEEEIKRVVRRHLRGPVDDVIETVDKLGTKVDKLAEGLERLAAKFEEVTNGRQQLIDTVTDSFSASTSRLTGEIGDAMTAIGKVNKEIADLREAEAEERVSYIPIRMGGYVK